MFLCLARFTHPSIHGAAWQLSHGSWLACLLSVGPAANMRLCARPRPASRCAVKLHAEVTGFFKASLVLGFLRPERLPLHGVPPVKPLQCFSFALRGGSHAGRASCHLTL